MLINQIKPIIELSATLRQRIEGILDRQISLGEESRAAQWLVQDTRWTITYALNLLRQLRRGLDE